MTAKIKIPFNALPERTRARFVAATTQPPGGQEVAPVLAEKTMKVGAYILWTIVLLVVSVILLGLISSRFGSVYEPRAPIENLLGYMLGFFMLAYGVLAMVRRFVRDRATPYARGRYLFGTDIVQATEGTDLVIWPLARIQRVNVIHNHRNGVYVNTRIEFVFQDGKRENFMVHGHAKAQQTLDQLSHQQRAVSEAIQVGDIAHVHRLDIFSEVRGTSIWNEPPAAEQAAAHPSGNHLASKLPTPLRLASVSALVLSLLAVPVWMIRNSLSDNASFERAVASGRSRDIQAYLDLGGSRTEEAQEALFRAAFAEAQQAGTVTALRDYINQYPNSPHLAEVRQVMHQRFEAVKATFLSQASQSDPAMPAFVEQLLAWLEANNSPPVQVRFSPPSNQTLAELDASLGQRNANISPIAPHFTDERSEPRESSITDVFSRGFSAVFPNDVMSLAHAGRADINTPAGVPSVDIRYEVRPSGTTFTDEQNGREFVGIHVTFYLSMHVPGVPQTHDFTVAVEPPGHFTVSYQDYLGTGTGGPSDGAVYSTMSRLAFEKLSGNIALHFFRPGSPAFNQAAGELDIPGVGRPLAGNGCTNTCDSHHDNECDDGGPNSLYAVCDLGTDCADCGPRTEADALGAVTGAGGTAPPAAGGNAGCTNTCPSSNDGECDDGGPNSLYDICGLGTDCGDCGPR